MLIIHCKSLIFNGGQVRTEADKGGHHQNFVDFFTKN